MFKKWGTVACLLMMAAPAFASGPNVTTNAGQRYITIQTYWSDLTPADRQKVVNDAVVRLRNEIAAQIPILKNPTLTNSLLSTAFMTQVTTELTRYLDTTNNISKSSGLLRTVGLILPKAFLVTIGGSGGFHWMVGGKISLDLGLVVMLPSFRTVIDTADRDAQNQPKIIEDDQFHLVDASIVAIPHGYGGIGVGFGGTLSIGVAGIWGTMASASDFHGAVVAVSGGLDVPLPFLPFIPDGGDLDLGVVANPTHIFGLLRLSADKGAEAAATADLEAGDVMTLAQLTAGK